MKKMVFYSIFIIFFKIIYIINDTNFRRNQEMEDYIFSNITNIKCNESNYNTSFSASICGEAQIKSNQFFGFKVPDTKNNNHSIKCSIIVENSTRKLDFIYNLNNSIDLDYYYSEIKKYIEMKVDTNKQTEKNNKKQKEKDNFSEHNSIDANDLLNFKDITEPTKQSTLSEKIKLPIYSKKAKQSNQSQATDSLPQSETTIPSTKTEIVNKTINSTSEYCYETICSIEGMIRESFQIKVENYLPIYVEEVPEDIFIIPVIPQKTVYKVNKCYLIKNIFKQVLKFKANNSQKKITFRLVSIILGKVEKNEELIADILLKKKEQNLRFLDNLDKNTAKCKSLYNVEPVEGKEISNSYNCVIDNIEKPEDYSGLIFNSSLDVKNIPNDSNLTDPAITDNYIKQGKLQDFSLSEFNPISLEINNCDKTSQFIILGKLSKELDEIFYFNIFIFLNDNKNTTANCTLPGGIRGEINVTCQVHNYFNNSFINIPPHIINGEEDEPILNITGINYESNVTCQYIPIISGPIETDIVTEIETENDTISENITQTTIISELIDSDIIFRQISHLEINADENIIKFNLIGFTFNSLKKNSYMPIPINLIKLNDISEEKNSTCILNMDTDGNSNKYSPLTFNCEILNIDEITKVTDVKIISSPLVKNIKIGYSEIVFANKTDNLINQGLLLDYMKDENLNKVPPILKSPLIISYSCYNDGTFSIEGFIDSSFEKNIFFYLELIGISTDSRCKIPKTEANKMIIIQCNTMESFSNKKIQIDSKIAYDMDYNELFYLDFTESNSYVTCQNNQRIKMEEANKKLKAVYSFRQASNFKRELNSNKYQFFLATFTKGDIGINSKLAIKVKIKSETQNKIKSYNKRKLSRTQEVSSECSISMKTEIDENGVGSVGWICTTKESSITDATGLDIIDSEEMSGIPNNPELIDPAKTDVLIEKGEIKDYSIEENLNELLPVFNILAMNYSLCRKNGTFTFTGNMSSTIIKDITFDLNISYPETVFACRLPKALKGQTIQIECINRENFENSSLLIEETVIRDGFNEFFIFRNISSGELLVTCTSSEKNVSQKPYEGSFNIIKKNVKDESSSGIGNTGIIILIVVGSIVIFGIIMLFVFLKIKTKKKITSNNNDKNSANSSGSIKNSSSSSFY